MKTLILAISIASLCLQASAQSCPDPSSFNHRCGHYYDQCKSDSDCGSTHKCCPDPNCGNFCVSGDPSSPASILELTLVSPPNPDPENISPPRTSPETISPPRPSPETISLPSCPNPETFREGRCAWYNDQCKSDSDCGSTHKCCPNPNCGNFCVSGDPSSPASMFELILVSPPNPAFEVTSPPKTSPEIISPPRPSPEIISRRRRARRNRSRTRRTRRNRSRTMRTRRNRSRTRRTRRNRSRTRRTRRNRSRTSRTHDWAICPDPSTVDFDCIQVFPPQNGCQSNSDCGDQLCCPTMGCGQQCFNPVITSSTCRDPNSYGRTCIQYKDQCQSDRQCRNGSQCCLVARCGKECV